MPQTKRLAVQSTEPLSITPQEVFTLILKRWNKFDHEWSDGICLKISHLEGKGIIDYESSRMANNMLRENKNIAIEDFGATENTCYWWPEDEQVKRKQFVKYLSEL